MSLNDNYFKVEPVIVISWNFLKVNLLGDIDEFIRNLEETSKELKRVSNYDRGIISKRIYNFSGDEFSFGVYKRLNGTFQLSLWDITGSTSIFNGDIPEIIADRSKVIDGAENAIKNYSRGFVTCSDCKELVEYEPIRRNKYFAGIYCTNCWDNKWKEIESKENYN